MRPVEEEVAERLARVLVEAVEVGAWVDEPRRAQQMRVLMA